MGKKILVPCLDVLMIAFFQFSIKNMDSFTVYFSGKRRLLLHQNTAQKICFVHHFQGNYLMVTDNFSRDLQHPGFKEMDSRRSAGKIKPGKTETSAPPLFPSSSPTPFLRRLTYGRRPVESCENALQVKMSKTKPSPCITLFLYNYFF